MREAQELIELAKEKKSQEYRLSARRGLEAELGFG